VEQVFGWIGQIFQTLLKLLPWLVIVPATHGGVAFVRGHQVKEWKPGLHWFWPVVTHYKLMTIVRQTQLIQSRVIMTKDLRTVIVGALVTYFVDDVVQAVAKIADLPSDVIERSQGAIFSAVSENTLEEIQANRLQFNKNLTEKISGTLNGYGVQVLQAQLTEFAPCRALAISGHAAVGHHGLWTGF
jgi:regulator of protease activity HflC (stomatin/prohibitin superfamily)